MLSIPAFRRLWLVTAVSATGDWLSLLALSALATQLTSGYAAQSFALGGVVAIKLLPALVLGPLAGALADKFDRRKLMVIADLCRFALFLSIPLVGSLWWLFVATFLIEVCALFWIPAKDAAVPNLLRRPDQVETANQLSLMMTYGVAVIVAAGLFALISSASGVFQAATPTTTVYIALMINGTAYLLTALTVWFGIREISGRSERGAAEARKSVLALLRDGSRFVRGTPLVRGLVIGIVGAVAAGGAVIATARLYATSLGGGDAAYGVLFIAMFVGMAVGMAATPRLSRRLPHNRLFGAAIVGAGLALLLVAVSPHLFVALATVGLVGCLAGIAFLTGLTIIGSQVADAVRGRVVGFVQSIVRVDLIASMAIVPFLVGLVAAHAVTIGDHMYVIDGTRIVLFAGGLVAAVVGVLAYRQMDDQRAEPLLPDLIAALRRGDRRSGTGLLVAVEGTSADQTAEQTRRLVAWLESAGYPTVQPVAPGVGEQRLAGAVRGAALDGPRARALAAAAVHADLVERGIRPSLSDGSVVVVDRFLAGPLTQFGIGPADAPPDGPSEPPDLDPGELENLTLWATGRLRPDITVLLDDAPADDALRPAGAQPWNLHRLLGLMATAEPKRYLVVDADAEPDVVAQRVRDRLQPLLGSPRVARVGEEPNESQILR